MMLTETACRFGRRCEYEVSEASRFGPTPSPSSRSESSLSSNPVTPSHLKKTIIHQLEPHTPESIVSAYHEAIESWFPIIPTASLRSRLQSTWDEIPLDVALLCLSILLLTTSPSPTAQYDGGTSELENFYLKTKSNLAFAEGFRFNSFPIVQSRILIILFEVSHGFYPTAYISIGATVRAADALQDHSEPGALPPHCSDGPANHEETVLTWCGILILDR